ncbi:hypothetical protein GF314_15260 [bacterium]|nr:hypothetical protein [bacterium]
MRQLWAIARRETRAFLGSVQGPVIGAGFLVLTGLFYYLFVRGYADASLATVRSGRPVFLNLHAGIFHKLYGDVVLFFLFLMPAITMRLLSGEYRSRRYDLLASWPVPAWRWVTGKWLSALAMAAVLLVATSFYFVLTGLLGRITDPVVAPAWQPMLTSLLGLLLLAGTIAAWGVAASAMIAHQAGAYFLGFAISLGLFLVGQLEPYLPGALGVVVHELALDQHFLSFAGGVVDSRDVVYYLGLTAVGLAVASAGLAGRRLSAGRRTRPWLTVAVVVVIAVFLQLVALRRPLRADFTPDQLYSLAPQTEQVLEAIESEAPDAPPVEILAFYQSIDGARQSARALLESFADASARIEFELLDPDTRPERAMAEGVTVTRTVVVRCGDRRRVLLEPGEGQLASAVYRVATDTRPVVYWLLGHGEARIDLEETGGATLMASALSDAGYEVRPLVLADRRVLPADADLVIWAGPKLDPVSADLDLLAAFLREGGAMACFFGPDTPASVQRWTERFNVGQEDNVMVAPSRGGARAGVDLRTIAVTEGYGDHPAVEPMQAITTTFPLVQTLRPRQRQQAGVTGNAILFTGPDSWAETDPEHRYSGIPSYDPPEDLAGPLPFGVAMRIAPADTAQEATSGGRLVVIGSSAFVTNANLGLYGNRDLALNLVGWLAEEEDLLGIRGRRTSYQPLLLDDGTKEWLGWASVLGWPALVGLAWFGLVQYRQWRH